MTLDEMYTAYYSGYTAQLRRIQTESLKKMQPQTYRPSQRVQNYNAEKRFHVRLVSPKDDWLNDDIAHVKTTLMPVVERN